MVWSRISLVVVFLFFTSALFAQVNRYMVFFKDKNGSGFTTGSPTDFLSQRAIDRRIQQAIPITEQDFPVNGNYVLEVRDAGADVFFTTRWMNGVLVQCNASLVSTIESLPSVDRVEYVAPNTRLQNNGRNKNSSKSKSVKAAVKTQAQLQMIGLDEMQSAGYKGQSIVIGIFDSGFQGVNVAAPFQHIFNEGRINLEVSKDFVSNTSNVFQYDAHGTEVFSVIAAYQDGTFTGGSYLADYQLYVTEDVPTEYRIEEYNWLFAAERADSAGVDIINSSLGYYDFDDASMDYPKSALDGKTTVVSKAAQFAADRGIVVVCSAGNEGGRAWQIITAPADAKDVLAIANVNSMGIRSGSSSIGPAADGRIKPDLAAMGVSTSVIKSDGTSGSASGTSLSSPLVTSLVAGVWQRYPELTNKEVMEVIRNSASQSNNPDNLLGFGIPNFKAVVNFLERIPQENTFEVYPNPISSDTLTVKPYDPSAVGSCRVEILSANGQVVYNGEVSFSWLNRSYTADLSQLTAGIYFLHVWWEDKRYTYRLVKV